MIPLIKELFTSKEMGTAFLLALWVGFLTFLGAAIISWLNTGEDTQRAFWVGIAAAVPVMLSIAGYGASVAKAAIDERKNGTMLPPPLK